VQVALTVGLIGVLAGWAFVVIRRLGLMREEVKLAWQRLEADRDNEAVKNVYNKHVSTYNGALEGFPANVIAPLAGLKPARRF
jgi:hypothetical protein